MANKKCPECEKCLPGWLVQFGDLMSLLLTFFILLLSMAVMDKRKVEEYFDVMKKAMGFLDQNADIREQTDAYGSSEDSGSEDEDSSDASEQAAMEIEEIIEEINESSDIETEQLEITKGKNEFTLDIPSSLMFEEGEYKLANRSSKIFIAKIARVIRTMPQNFSIEIIGYTNRSTFSSSKIPRDGWDMSALRAISVVKELIKNRIDPAQLKVSAYSSFHPKSEVADENRRVEMKFYSDESQSNVLEEESFFDRLE
ncbi:MAG: OmpA family protein [Campylobacterales bacterium]|nr:OmpA family protein [Campylobacterales bacterium]